MIERLFRKNILEISRYNPGKSKEEIAKKYNIDKSKIIKMASNENPLGAPEKAVENIRKFAPQVYAYPDPRADELRDRIASYIGTSRDRVIVGNGSDEVLEICLKLFLNAGEECIIPIPTFSIYEAFTKLYSGRVAEAKLTEDFRFDADAIIRRINEKTKIVFICSPNNPTGSTIERKKLVDILGNDVAVLLDEAYAEFSDVSFAGLANKYENLIVLRTFSKAFGLAGLRVGYGIAGERVIENMLKIKAPFNVNVLAQKAAIGALDEPEFLKRTVKTVKKEREFLLRELSGIDGVKVYPSKANFLLLRTEKMVIANELMKKGVIIRDCSSTRGLDARYLRVSVGTRGENETFLACLKEILH